MNVKLLLFPLSITVALAVLIFYAKPEFDSVMSNREALQEKQAFEGELDEKIQNTKTLEASLSSNKDNSDTVYRYVPDKRDDDRVIDGVNFLASQSGLTLTGVKIEKGIEPKATITKLPDATESGSAPLVFSSNADINTIRQTPATPATPKVVNAIVTASGTYESIRDTVARITHMDRFQNFNYVSIERAKPSEKMKDVSNVLDATISVNFAYLPKTNMKGNFNHDILKTAKYDFGIVNSLKQYASTPVPGIEVGASSTSNPFRR